MASVEERRAVLKSFVKEIVKGDAEATVYHTLPIAPESGAGRFTAQFGIGSGWWS